MKEYNRKTRKWEEKSTEVVPDLKTRELCLKKQPHNYVLKIPSYHTKYYHEDYTEEQVLLYYKVKDTLFEMTEAQNKILEDAGITNSIWRQRSKEPRTYKCDVCGKQKYD